MLQPLSRYLSNLVYARRVVISIVQVSVRDNNVEQALRVLKRKLQREGVFGELRNRKHYEKPSEKKKRRKKESMRRKRSKRSD